MNQKINCIYSWFFTQSWVKNETSYSNNGCYTKSWNESANAHLSLSVAKSDFLDTLHEIVYSSFHKPDFFQVRLFLSCHWFHHFCGFFSLFIKKFVYSPNYYWKLLIGGLSMFKWRLNITSSCWYQVLPVTQFAVKIHATSLLGSLQNNALKKFSIA